MKHTLATVISIIALAFAVSSCGKAPINGDLDGMWQLTSIERHDGETYCQKDVFWAFQLHLVQLGDRKIYGRFENNGKTMRIYSLATVSEHQHENQNDEWIDESNIGILYRYGLYNLDTTFRIERLDDHAMILNSSDARLTFRKY